MAKSFVPPPAQAPPSAMPALTSTLTPEQQEIASLRAAVASRDAKIASLSGKPARESQPVRVHFGLLGTAKASGEPEKGYTTVFLGTDAQGNNLGTVTGKVATWRMLCAYLGATSPQAQALLAGLAQHEALLAP